MEALLEETTVPPEGLPNNISLHEEALDSEETLGGRSVDFSATQTKHPLRIKATNGSIRGRRNRWNKEQKVAVLEYIRKLMQLNPGQSKHEVTKTVSKESSISMSVIGKWINKEPEILALPDGGRRLNKMTQNIIQEDEDSLIKDRGYLRLPPRKLADKKIITKEVLNKMHNIDCPVPFIQMEKGKFSSYKDVYASLGYSEDFSHPGHPPDITSSSQPPIKHDIDIHSQSLYKKDSAKTHRSGQNMTAHEVNKELYYLAPAQEPGRDFHAVKECVSLICRCLLNSSEKVSAVIPVQIEFDSQQPDTPGQWAILITSVQGAQVLIPLSLSLYGPFTTHNSKHNALYLQGWTIDHGIVPDGRAKDYYESLRGLFRVFNDSIVLYVKDVGMLFSTETSWHPRRFMSTWDLYMSPIHAKNAAVYFISPVEGTYMNLEILVERMLQMGCRVSLSAPVNTPFQVLRPSDFSLKKQFQRPDMYDVMVKELIETISHGFSSRGKKNFEDLEQERLAWNKKETRKAALRRQLQHGAQVVDGKRKCYILECPFPLSSPALYCKYHVRSIIEVARLHPQSQFNDQDEWRCCLPLTETVSAALRKLKDNYSHTWLIDFEFISLRSDKSPIPMQLAIRSLGGQLLLATNVDYGKSLEEFCEEVLKILNQPHLLTDGFFRCYKSLTTNGIRPSEIRKRIFELGYDPSTTQILSYGSSQDMMCFQRLINDGDALIVPRHGHEKCSNFQTIDFLRISRQVFPHATRHTLQNIHCGLMGENFDESFYHHAANDTQALAAVAQKLLELA